jgi:hypothetical protein
MLVKEYKERGKQMDICEERQVSKWSMKQEIIDDLENYNEATDDNIREICRSLVPVYNSELIDLASHYSGEEYWELWLNNELGGETPLDILRGNVFALYYQIGCEVLEERENEE